MEVQMLVSEHKDAGAHADALGVLNRPTLECTSPVVDALHDADANAMAASNVVALRLVFQVLGARKRPNYLLILLQVYCNRSIKTYALRNLSFEQISQR